jgi:Tol biopolymer transport system component
VTPARLDIFSPGWSPTGSRIVFIGQVEVSGAPLPEWEIFTVRLDGTGLTRLTETKAEEFDP